jgi:hypothetical protein
VEPFEPAYETLWRDVQWAADRVHRAVGTDCRWRWHHLLLTAANFKAQMPVFPAQLPPLPVAGASFERDDTLNVPVPSGTIMLRSEDPHTWQELSEHVRGLGVARTTTVLSALWPGRHVIADWRALSAAAALIGARKGWSGVPVEPNRTDRLDVDWKTYSWYRRAVLECAAQERLQPVCVERALYRLGVPMPGVTWIDYASRIEERLAAAFANGD